MNNEKNNLETLEGLEENPYEGKTTDIKQSIFKSTSTYQTPNSFSSLNDTSNNQNENIQNKKINNKVNTKKVQPKKKEKAMEIKKVKEPKGSLKIPVVLVLILIIAINVGWYLAVRMVIIPNYEDYQKESKELRKQIDALDSKVKAIIGD